MRVFDDMERSCEEAAAYDEPHFTYLNRTARSDFARVRALIEEWFSGYPAAHRDDLRARLRSRRDETFMGAFFELYVHESLRRLGYEVEVHPINPSGATSRPDFLAVRSGSEGIYVEARVAMDRSDAKAAAQARINRAFDALNRLHSPDFFLNLEVDGVPDAVVPADLRRAVARFLKAQDYERCVQLLDAGGLAALPSETFRQGGFVVRYSAIPKAKASRGEPGLRPIGMLGPARPYRLDNLSALRGAIRRKANKYRHLDRPLMIAVNAVSQRLENRHVMEALFGTECLVVRGDHRQATRRADGIWQGAGGPQHRAVSAVLVVSSLCPWSLTRQALRIYHHPWALRPCLDDLADLPQAVPSHDRVHMELRDGIKPHALFGLPEDWPGD